MKLNIDLSSLIVLAVATILSFVAATVLFWFARNKTKHNRWLAAYFLCAGYGSLVTFLIYSKLITDFPWYDLYRTGYIAGFLFMPFSYFYMRDVTQQKKFNWKDIVNFLPVIIFIIDLFPFYLNSPEQKIQQIKIDTGNMNTIWNEFSQGWLGIGFLYVRLRIVLTIMYWLLQFFMIRRLFILAKDNNLLVENRDLVKWLKIFMASQAVFFVPYFVNIFAGTKKEFFFVTHILLMVSVAISLLSLFMLPKVLYGLKGLVLSTDKDEHTLTQNEIKSADKRHSYLAKDKLEMLSSLITKHFLQTKPYLKKGYTVGTLAAEIDLQPYVVSAVVNQAFQVNANDFINRYRITYAKQLIHKGEAELQTLEAMAEKCGFNNRNSFTTAFKKHTGKTPSGFISEYKKQKARQEKAPFE